MSRRDDIMLVFATAAATSALIGAGALVYLRLWQSPDRRSRPSTDPERTRSSATQRRAKAISPFQANLIQKQSSGDGHSLRSRDRHDVSSAHSEHQRTASHHSPALMPKVRGKAAAFLAEEPDEYSRGEPTSVGHAGRPQRSLPQTQEPSRPLPRAVLEAQAKAAAAKSSARGGQRPLPRAVLEAQQKQLQQTKSKRSSSSTNADWLPELPSRSASPGTFDSVSSIKLQCSQTSI